MTGPSTITNEEIEFLYSLALHHLHQFMDQMRLWPTSGRGLVAVSGGIDSMFLLTALVALRSRTRELSELKVLHINHGTRFECSSDQALVSSYCKSLEVACENFQLNLDLQQANFEKYARAAREKIYQQLLRSGDRLYTGHHIDDSLEWSLLQGFRSSNPKACLGIPVVKGQKARPLMAFSRRQIETLAREIELPFREDGSNFNLRFDRNFLRHEVIPPVRERWPGYLKLYIERMSELARQWGVERASQALTTGNNVTVYRPDPYVRGLLVSGQNYRQAIDRQLLRAQVEGLSLQGRGVLYGQLAKLQTAIASQAAGPLEFSGRLQAWPLPGGCILRRKGSDFHWQLGSQIPGDLILHLRQILAGQHFCPFVFVTHPKLTFKGLTVGRKHPLGEQILKIWQEREVRPKLCHTLKLLWAMQQGKIHPSKMKIWPVFLSGTRPNSSA